MRFLLLVIALGSWVALATAASFPAPVTPVAAVLEGDTPDPPLRWPLDGKFLQGYSYYHRGIDIGAAYGTPIGAAEGGWVEEVSYQAGYGIYVVVGDGSGIETLYSHMADKAVEPGQRLAAGDLVGWVGATGYATTPHLHFEVHVNGVRTNPLPYLP